VPERIFFHFTSDKREEEQQMIIKAEIIKKGFQKKKGFYWEI
jgi:hypothetical protein